MAKVRIMIVDDAAPVRDAVRRMLELEDDFLVIGEAENGEEAVNLARKLLPDVILMDINMPRMDGITATARIVADQQCNVIMLSVEGESEYLRRAMQAGARDFLIKPFSPDDLAAAIRRCGVQASGREVPRRGRITTVFSTKGGVGKSTIAAHLAVALAMEGGHRVALADFDTEFGVLAQMLSLKPHSSAVDLCRLQEMVTPARAREALVPYQDTKLSLLAAPPAPHLAAEVEGEAKGDRTRNYAEEILCALREGWDEVVVDTGAGFREANMAALDLADTILLVTVPEIPALHNTAKALNILLSQLEYPREKVRLVLNHADTGHELDPDDVASALDYPVHVTLPTDRSVQVAVNAGQPVLGRRARSPFGQAIGRLAESVSGEKPGDAARPAEEHGSASLHEEKSTSFRWSFRARSRMSY